jgi:hypothetical protein
MLCESTPGIGMEHQSLCSPGQSSGRWAMRGTSNQVHAEARVLYGELRQLRVSALQYRCCTLCHCVGVGKFALR